MWFALSAALAADPFELPHVVKVLDNGLTVILAEDHNTDSVALHLHYGVGSRDERPGEFGCAHLFEHLMFEGSRNVPNNAFDGWLTAAGGDNNAYTSTDETAYHMRFPSGALDLALMLESDRMGFLDAGIDQANLENQQKVVLQERAEGYDEPGGKSWDAFQVAYWPADHPYQHAVIGTVADIEGFTVDGTLDFWRRHYRPRNAVLGLVGNFDSAEAMAAVEKWFSDVPDTGPPEPRGTVEITRSAPRDAIVRDRLLVDNVEDYTLWMAWPTVEYGHPDEAPLDLLANALTNGRGTRLADALQYKKSVVSSIYAFHPTGDLGGQWMMIATVDDMPLAKLRKRIDKEMAKLDKAPITADEVDRARKAIRAGLLDQLESVESRASVLVDCHRRFGKPDCVADLYAPYEAVTPADVMRVWRTYFDPAARVSLSVVPPGSGYEIPGSLPVELP